MPIWIGGNNAHTRRRRAPAAGGGNPLAATATALRPGGVLALDLCDLAWGRARRGQPSYSDVTADWALITRFSTPSPDRYVREMATFRRNDDGTWRRDDERHDNVLIDAGRVPPLLAEHGVRAHIAPAFGAEQLPEGLIAVVGHRPG